MRDQDLDGVRGLDIANTLDMKPLYHHHWNPLWEAVDASGLPVHIHTIGGKMPDTEGLTHLEQRAAFATFITGFQLKMKPSGYWRRQCYATYQSDPIGVRLIDVLGGDNVMWGSDFPHPDGVWPDSQEFIAREMAGVDPGVQRKVLWENAARLFGLPLEPAASAPAEAQAAD